MVITAFEFWIAKAIRQQEGWMSDHSAGMNGVSMLLESDVFGQSYFRNGVGAHSNKITVKKHTVCAWQNFIRKSEPFNLVLLF